MTIRQYSPDDLPGIRWLHDRTPPAGQISVRPQRWPEMLDDIPSHFEAFWVATEMQDGVEAIVGMAGVQVVHGTDPDVMGVPVPAEFLSALPTARLEAVRVAPERQRRGIGRDLTQTAIDWAVAHGFRRLILDTTVQQEAAVALYTSMGFHTLGITEFGRWQIAWLARDLE
jgi:ribosomal protein S18 acetylase RimI-like enzyme